MNLKEKRTAALDAARKIAEAAKGRAFTDEERADVERHLADADRLEVDLKAAERDQARMKRLGALRGDAYDPPAAKGSAWARDTADQLFKAMPTGPDGMKSLVSGSVGTTTVLDPAVNAMGTLPTSLLDLLAVQTVEGSNTFGYLRQTTRTNNAAPVADGALKPTSVYTVTEIDDRFRVIAHLSEPTPLRFFSDYASLVDFLSSEMVYGHRVKLEQQLVSGNGTGENLTGLLNASGILTVAYSGSLLTTIRKALTSLQTASGTTPSAVVLSPADAEQFDLLADNTGQFLLGGPGQAAVGSLWSIPRVTSVAVPAGTALIGDFTAASIMQREAGTIALDTGGELFTRNQVVMRVEGRYGLALKRPTAFAKVALA